MCKKKGFSMLEEVLYSVRKRASADDTGLSWERKGGEKRKEEREKQVLLIVRVQETEFESPMFIFLSCFANDA